MCDERPLGDLAEVVPSATSDAGDGWNWGLAVALAACLTLWAGVTAGIYLVLA